MSRRRLLIGHLVVTACLILTACWSEPTGIPQPTDPVGSARAVERALQEGLLNEIRLATSRYRRVETAVHDGYLPATPCIYSSAGYGGRGLLYRKDTLVDAVVDPTQPEVLLYEPKVDGTRELVGVHYVVVAAPWDSLHPKRLPLLGSEPLRDRRGMPTAASSTYSLFVALWRDNPRGMYEDFNPAVTCLHALAAIAQ